MKKEHAAAIALASLITVGTYATTGEYPNHTPLETTNATCYQFPGGLTSSNRVRGKFPDQTIVSVTADLEDRTQRDGSTRVKAPPGTLITNGSPSQETPFCWVEDKNLKPVK